MVDHISQSNKSKITIILRGGPTVGKSTVSYALAQLFPRSVRIDQDVLRYMVVGGLIATKGKIKPYERPEDYFHQCRLADKNVFALTRNFVEAGFLTIISANTSGRASSITWYTFIAGNSFSRRFGSGYHLKSSGCSIK